MLVDLLTLKPLAGKRTYVLVAGALVGIFVQYASGDADLATSLVRGLEALGLATLRAAK